MGIDLKTAVVRYRERLEQEEHSVAKLVKGWDYSPDDDGEFLVAIAGREETATYLAGKHAGIMSAIRLLRQELESDGDS
jgi:hypothetical protein